MKYELFNEDFITGVNRLKDYSIDLVIADPPYCLGKDYGNNSDKKKPEEFLKWTQKWILSLLPKIKEPEQQY